jgi:CRISPR/Cas system endoribonuclease Cas6 (RAMP superfamily)
MLNAYNSKMDIILSFRSDDEIPYDYRNKEEPRGIIQKQFDGVGRRTPELLEELRNSKPFYFDKFSKIKMLSWDKGCVSLKGQEYCWHVTGN